MNYKHGFARAKNQSPEYKIWGGIITRQNIYLTLNGVAHTVGQWSRLTGIKRTTLSMRINSYGWSIERALTTPVKVEV
jgi:hypothetical protein